MATPFTMPKLLRPQTYPYASSSTGPYRGLLVRKYPCWDAKGPVRDLFMNEIAGKIKTCLEQCLPESNSFVGFSLFMVGKVPEKTKPTIMIVSDDKRRRKEAFQVVKSKNILAAYRGFELGHCAVAAEFEDLRQLGSDTSSSSREESPNNDYGYDGYDDYYDDYDDNEHIQHRNDRDEPDAELLSLLSTEACAFETPNGAKPFRLYFNTPKSPHSHNSASATCGGLFMYKAEVYALTMAHAIRPFRRTVMNPEPRSDSSSQSDDFEITGMEEWDEDDEEGDTKTLTAITSPGSRTPSELSDSEDSLLKRNDSRLSSEISVQTRFATGPSVIYEESYTMDDYEDDEDVPEICERVGSVVGVDRVLDIAVIKTTLIPSVTGTLHANPIQGFLVIDDPTMASVTVTTTRHDKIKGQRSPTPFYTRLPGTDNFLELYSVQLRTPLRPGDSGSWAFNEKGELAGFVVAGNTQTGSCLLLPAKQALQSAESLLAKRERPAGLSTTDWPALLLSLATEPDPAALRDGPDEDGMTVASSLPPPSIFSQRMDRGTPSTTTTSHGRRPGASIARESLSRDEASSFVSKGDFLEDQVARLRRELERAWEIIQEKDKHLQHLITGNLHSVLRPPAKYRAPPQSGVDYSLPFSPIQDSARDPSQLSPLEQSNSPNVLSPEPSRTPEPETSADGDPLPTAAVVQSVRDSLDAWKDEVRDTMEEQKTMWQAQATANEALNKENKDLKRGIIQARTELWDMMGDPGLAFWNTGLTRVSDNLTRLLHRNTLDPELFSGPNTSTSTSTSKVQVQEEEPEGNKAVPINIPPPPRAGGRAAKAFNEAFWARGLSRSSVESRPIITTKENHMPYKQAQVDYEYIPREPARDKRAPLKSAQGKPVIIERYMPLKPAQGKPLIDRSDLERPAALAGAAAERRILKPKSRLSPPLSSSRGLRPSFSDVGSINTVLEEDEDNTMEDDGDDEDAVGFKWGSDTKGKAKGEAR